MTRAIVIPLAVIAVGCVSPIPLEQQVPTVTYQAAGTTLVSVIDERDRVARGKPRNFVGVMHITYGIPVDVHVAQVLNVAEGDRDRDLAEFLRYRIVRGLNQSGWNAKPRFRATNAFFAGATVWTGLQLIVALLISVPPINTLFHGTHVITAHAMGSMIGTDSMILWGAVAWVLSSAGAKTRPTQQGWSVMGAFAWLNLALLPFWAGLLFSGFAHGMQRYMGASAPTTFFSRFPLLFAWSGAAAALGILWLLTTWVVAAWGPARGRAPADDAVEPDAEPQA